MEENEKDMQDAVISRLNERPMKRSELAKSLGVRKKDDLLTGTLSRLFRLGRAELSQTDSMWRLTGMYYPGDYR